MTHNALPCNPRTDTDRQEYDRIFLDGYIACALWSSNDESRPDGGDPLDDNYGPEDLAPECHAQMAQDCAAFVADNWADLTALGQRAARLDGERRGAAQNGHDFWLSRNGHGTGFWDRGHGARGDKLHAATKPYGEVNLFVGDDGLIYSL